MEKPKKQKSVKHATAKKAAAKGVRSLDETGPAIRKPVKNINLQDTDDFEKFTPLDEEEFDNLKDIIRMMITICLVQMTMIMTTMSYLMQRQIS